MLQKIQDFLSALVPSDGEAVLMSIGAGFGAVVSFAFGNVDDAFRWLLAFIAADYVTGTVAAFRFGEWSSQTGFLGLFKKFFILCVVAMCHGLDVATGVNLLRNAAIFAYGLNEVGSILENVDRLGYGKLIPAVIRRGIRQMRDKEEELFTAEENQGE